MLPLEIDDHERLAFIITFCIHQTDFIELHFMIRTIYVICTNIQALICVTVENPFCHRIGYIQFKPAMIIRCCVCLCYPCYRLQILSVTENPDINLTMELLSLFLLLSSSCALSSQGSSSIQFYMDEIESLTHQFRL